MFPESEGCGTRGNCSKTPIANVSVLLIFHKLDAKSECEER